MHIVFSTKNRQPLIEESIESSLYAYLAGICQNLECVPLKIGGYKDHIHILCLLSKKIRLAELVEALKSHSSKWINTIDEKYEGFYWQNGYGTFSVDPSKVDSVCDYISNQKQHHIKKSFQEEYVTFLKEYKVTYDERYVWT